MARYERDPRLRRRLALLLVLGEVLALSVVFFAIFYGYFNWFNQRFLHIQFLRPGPSERLGLHLSLFALGVTLLVDAVFIAQAVLYVKGRSWTRLAFLGQNGFLIAMGLIWFVVKVARADVALTEAREVGFWAVVLPMATLFPLLWPLRVFRPVRPGGA